VEEKPVTRQRRRQFKEARRSCVHHFEIREVARDDVAFGDLVGRAELEHSLQVAQRGVLRLAVFDLEWNKTPVDVGDNVHLVIALPAPEAEADATGIVPGEDMLEERSFDGAPEGVRIF
jgi:hypothetical protein